AVGVGDTWRAPFVKLETVTERQVIDHVHDLELKPTRLPGVAIPERDHAALLLRVEQDEGAIALDTAPVTNDPVPGVIVATPTITVPGRADPLEELAQPATLGWCHDVG